MEEIKEVSNAIKIADVEVTLVNEKLQVIDDTLLLVFESNEKIEVLLAQLDKKQPIEFDESVYDEYTVLNSFGFKNTDKARVYRVELAKPLISPEVAKAIEIAKVKATDTDAVSIKGLLDKFENYVGQPMSKGTRFTYNDDVYKAVNDIALVDAEKMPDVNSDFKKL